jgi:putative RNA 2'-phosphotransferase
MNEQQQKHTGKFLSLILRHQPQAIGITLDEEGWADVDALIAGCAAAGHIFTKADLEQMVADNDKQRYAFNDEHTKIRANQGHSLEVDLNFEPANPPEILYHGTVDKFIDPIFADGLVKKSRQHVHLSQDLETAVKVGSRRGAPVVLKVKAGEMSRNGHLFYLSANGVWLTDNVPPMFLEKMI